MNNLVKIIISLDGEEISDPTWCACSTIGDGHRTLCSGEIVDDGEVVIQSKTTIRGGITCEECIEVIKEIKSIKL